MAKNKAEKNVVNSGMAPYVFYKDRVASFKNYKYDSDKDATCTSKTLARAGFVFTGDVSAMCPFCVKCLEFDPDDDPWEEHKKRGGDCEFVRIGKLEDSQLTLADTIVLAQHAIVMAKYKKIDSQIEQLEKRSISDFITAEFAKSTKPSATKTSTRRAK